MQCWYNLTTIERKYPSRNIQSLTLFYEKYHYEVHMTYAIDWFGKIYEKGSMPQVVTSNGKYNQTMGIIYGIYWCVSLLTLLSGGRLNKKDSLTRYGDSHVKDRLIFNMEIAIHR